MAVLNQADILKEITMSIRNADIFTTTQRGVVTATGTGTLASSTIINIPVANVKNIRSLIVGSTALAFGSDYTVNLNNSGVCTITLANTATANYSTTYDAGTDKIWPEYPREDLTITSFPRIAVEYIDINSEIGGFGNVNRNIHDLTISVYDTNKDNVRNYIHTIREWIILNQNRLYYLKLIKPSAIGPLVIAGEFEKFKDKIMKQNIDFKGSLQYEIN